MSDSEESVDEGLLVASKSTGNEIVADPFALAQKHKKVSYGSFASMSTNFLPIES
jgi:hypothetical protein